MKRIALVIGNSAYQNVAPLANPANDASAMAAMFKSAGFDIVDFRRDIKATELRRALRDFSDKAREADMAIIYFAGHGVEIDGTNYLVPIDAVLERSMDAFDEAISLDRMLDVITPAKQLRLVILDACRDNPFNKTMKRTATRALDRGLAKVEPVSPNTMVAFAAKAGSTAADGDDRNSPFTTALVKYLPRPGLDLRKAFGFVRDEVLKTTSNRQEPFIYGSLGGEDVSLVPAVAPTARPFDPSEARRDYELALQINVPSAWDAFINRYPSGFYTDLANAQRDKLRAAEGGRPAARPQQEAKAAAIESPRLAAQERLAAESNAAAERAKAAAAAKAAQEALEKEKAAEAARAAEIARAKAAQEREAVERQRAAEAAAATKAAQEREAARVAEVARIKAVQEREALERQKAAEAAAAAKAAQDREAVRLAEVARIKAAQEREALEKQKAAEAAAAAKSAQEREAARVAEIARVKAAQEREALERQKAAEAAAAAKAVQEREAAVERQKAADAARSARIAQEQEAFERQKAADAAKAAKAAQERETLERQKAAEAVAATKAAQEREAALERQRIADAAKAAENAADKAAAAARAKQAKSDSVVVAAIDPKIAGETKREPLPPQGCLGASIAVAPMASRALKTLSPAEECGLKPKDVFKECEFCPEMVMVPAGDVVMGSNRAEIDNGLASTNEGPQHRAIIKQPIAVGRFEVTRDQYAVFARSSGNRYDERCFTFEQNIPQERDNRSFLNPGFSQSGDHPAVCISWMSAKAYVAWLSQTTGKQYRLLSEAEFEYAARAGGTARFGFGNDAGEICKFANGADQSAKAAGLPGDVSYMGCKDGYPFTSPVGTYAANAFGLYDLIGNVWEWTEDCFYGDYATARADSAARTETGCSARTVRGGDWFSTESSLRPAARAKANFDARHDDIGFRVVRVLDRF